MRLTSLALAALICFSLPAPVPGLEWTVVPERSQVLFDYSRNDQPAVVIAFFPVPIFKF